MRETIVRYFRIFLITHFFISINTAIVGQHLEPDAHLTYHSMWGSVIMAFLCIFPSFLLHSTKDLSIRQVIIRRVIQVLMIEGIVLGFLYIVVPMRDIKTALIVAGSVVIVYGVICVVDWVQGCMDAETMNRRLEQLKKEQQ